MLNNALHRLLIKFSVVINDSKQGLNKRTTQTAKPICAYFKSSQQLVHRGSDFVLAGTAVELFSYMTLCMRVLLL